ncbi:MAG: 4-aminobutyrate--2-oxoglutarate transaminase [Actinomycetaceae bacterium]|nr:4-aminobutyrate--2-oxoglutarate transaminase [Actinomycetaceae bacterium]
MTSSTTRTVQGALPGPLSAEFSKRRDAAVAPGVATQSPHYVAKVDKGLITDVDGNTIIDLTSGIAVTTVGASHPKVVKAVQDQAAAFSHTCFMTTPYEGYVRVCEELNRVTPGDFPKTSALFNSGSEALENAVKIARKYTGRQAIVVFDHAYHGRTNLTLAMTAKNIPYKDGFGPFAPEIYRMPTSYPLRDGLSGAQAAAKTISRMEVQLGAANIAAVVIEPIQGEGGFIVPAEGFLSTLVDWCRANGIVFVADEVQSGFGRTGEYFACHGTGIEPDLICTAKGIAAGYPLSAVTGRAEIMASVQPGGLGGTYGGNPVSCAAALAVFDILESEDLFARARHIEQIIRQTLGANKDPRIAEIRGSGAMMAIEFVKEGSLDPNPALANAIKSKAYQEGVILLTCGSYGNVIRMLPPLTIEDEHLLEALNVIVDALAQTKDA